MDKVTAHVFQHEIDHLKGILYIDLINHGDLLTELEIKKFPEKQKPKNKK